MAGTPTTTPTAPGLANGSPAPRWLVVVTATGFADERTDGVAVVPITALGP